MNSRGFWASVLLATMCGQVYGIVDYCSENTFRSNSTWLQFTKEISSKEYVMSNKFKSLHCCAKGYRSIEWFKDGKAYPWPAGVSNLILYPESANQTIYSQNLVQSDGGNYSCLVSNDTHQHLHTTQLHVIDASGYTGSPLATYEPQDQYIALGETARLFCEAFVGRIDLPDAHNEVSWRRGDINMTSLSHLQRYTETAELREDGQVLGSHLVIRGVRRQDFGLYVCSISNTWFQVVEFPMWLRENEFAGLPMSHRLAYKQLLLVVCIVTLALVTLVALYLRFGLTVRRLVKDKFAKLEVDDGKEYDVGVLYSENDAEFVLGVLVPTLETRYEYRCAAQSLTAQPNTWSTEAALLSSKSRRLLAVLSPGLLEAAWTSAAIADVINTLAAIHGNLVCVTLQSLPRYDVKTPLGRLARQVTVLAWQPEQRMRSAFWAALRLRMPPQRGGRPQCHPSPPPSPSPSTLGAKHHANIASSNESLEVLV